VLKRRRIIQPVSLKDRLAAFAEEAREKASHLPPGRERDEMIKKARKAEEAFRWDDWVRTSLNLNDGR
jgi:hypothetical protein